jgi:quinol monooxygenase YgiN
MPGQEELMTPACTVAADFRVRADAIDLMKQVIVEVRPQVSARRLPNLSLVTGCRDPTLFLLYMEWRDKACFEAHVASPHVQKAEQRIEGEKLLTKPSGEWHFYRL